MRDLHDLSCAVNLSARLEADPCRKATLQYGRLHGGDKMLCRVRDDCNLLEACRHHQFGQWHKRAFVTILAENLASLANQGVTIQRVMSKCEAQSENKLQKGSLSFQRHAVEMVKARCAGVYFRDIFVPR